MSFTREALNGDGERDKCSERGGLLTENTIVVSRFIRLRSGRAECSISNRKLLTNHRLIIFKDFFQAISASPSAICRWQIGTDWQMEKRGEHLPRLNRNRIHIWTRRSVKKKRRDVINGDVIVIIQKEIKPYWLFEGVVYGDGLVMVVPLWETCWRH